jgi:hypothetical protein
MKTQARHYMKLGALEVYIELLKTGIREICIPNYGVAKKEELDYIDKEARKHGFYTMLITYNRTGSDGSKFKSYQRIIYRKNRKADAQLLRRRLQKTPKEKKDHEVIGRLLGYGKEVIVSFGVAHE